VLEGGTVDPVLRELPEVVHVGGADGRPAPWVEATLELVAGVTVGYSRSAFAARFRAVVGETPVAYLTRSRLAAAATLLARTTLSIGEVGR
jgi:AraC-like DNA-binding protein